MNRWGWGGGGWGEGLGGAGGWRGGVCLLSTLASMPSGGTNEPPPTVVRSLGRTTPARSESRDRGMGLELFTTSGASYHSGEDRVIVGAALVRVVPRTFAFRP